MLVLVRHGESTGNAAGLLLGRIDAPLTDRGRAQALAVGPRLGPVRALVSSPLCRALDTAAALDTGLEPVVDERWIEVDYGVFDGEALRDVPAAVWTQWRADPTFRPEGGETLAEAHDRVGRACAELFAEPGAGARSEAGDVVVVSHVSPIKAAVGWALGADAGVAWRLHLSTASITRIAWGASGPLLETFNEAAPA